MGDPNQELRNVAEMASTYTPRAKAAAQSPPSDDKWRELARELKSLSGEERRTRMSQLLPAVAAGRCVRRCGCELLEQDDLVEEDEDNARASLVRCRRQSNEDCVLRSCCDGFDFGASSGSEEPMSTRRPRDEAAMMP